MNLYTYCHNNPIFYFDSNGHNAFTKWCKNRGKDIKALGNDIKKGTKDTASSVNQKIIRPVSQKLDQGCEWIDNNIITPVYDGVNKFGKAVYHSTSLELGMGFGFGAEGKLGFVNGSLLAVPVRNEYIIADDCKTNSTTKFSADVDFGEIISAGAEAKCSAYNGNGDGYSWMMPGHEWNYSLGVSYEEYCLGFNNDEKPNFTFNVGGSAYFIIGGDISFSFDADKFLEILKE